MSSTTLQEELRRSPPAGYVPVSACLIGRSTHTITKVYAATEGASPRHLCDAGTAVSGPAGGKTAWDAEDLLLKESDFVLLSTQVLSDTPGLLEDEALPQSERFSMLVASLGAQAEQACSMIKPGRLIELCLSAAGSIFELLHVGHVDPQALHHAPRLANPWLNHAAGVSCYCVLLGIASGIRNEEELRGLATGGMLHDLGLRRPPEKNESRDESRNRFAQHPQLGYEQLLDTPGVDRDQLMMVYQHHEAVDGSGFPVGILQEEIHPWAQVLRVVDAFDELTHAATERLRMSVSDALLQLNRDAGAILNKEMVLCWTQVIA